MENKIAYWVIIGMFVLGTSAVIAGELVPVQHESPYTPVCLIDRPIADCEVYESGEPAWSPVLMTRGT